MRCTKCDCSIKNNYKPIMGEGKINAPIMFVGRNPNYFDRKQNSVLKGSEGETLQQFLDLFNFNDSIIYKTYAVKCTTAKRFPSYTEICNCSNLLLNEIKTVSPRIVVLMGNTAIKAVFNNAFGDNTNLLYLNNKTLIYDGIIYIFTYNPLYAYRSKYIRKEMFKVFTTILEMYRFIDPTHQTNINL